MARKARSSRRQLAEQALEELFASQIPDKDTGPDPHDIKEPPAAAGGMVARRGLGLNPMPHTIELDELDRDRANLVLTLLFEATGETMGLEEAVRVALACCPLDAALIARAWAEFSSRGDE
jgi:hypothetical protein